MLGGAVASIWSATASAYLLGAGICTFFAGVALAAREREPPTCTPPRWRSRGYTRYVVRSWACMITGAAVGGAFGWWASQGNPALPTPVGVVVCGLFGFIVGAACAR